MARLISDQDFGRRITLELSEEELGTIVSAMGVTSHFKTKVFAEENSYPYIANSDGEFELWDQLTQILVSEEAVVSQQ